MLAFIKYRQAQNRLKQAQLPTVVSETTTEATVVEAIEKDEATEKNN